MLKRSGRLKILRLVSKAVLQVRFANEGGISTIELMRTRILRSLLGWLEVGHGRDVGTAWPAREVLSGV